MNEDGIKILKQNRKRIKIVFGGGKYLILLMAVLWIRMIGMISGYDALMRICALGVFGPFITALIMQEDLIGRLEQCELFDN